MSGGSATPVNHDGPSVRVTLRCEYPGTGWPSDSVTFQPHPSLGATALEVHGEILRRLATSDDFELPAEGEPPFPYCSETVRRVLVWR